MSLHVIQLGPVPPPEGGISRNIAAIRKELLARGDACSLIATSRSSARVDESDVLYPKSGPELFRRLRGLRADIVHLHVGGEIGGRVLWLALASTLAGGRSVLTMHSGGFPLSELARNARPRSFAGIIFRRFARIICVNEEQRRVFLRFGCRPEDLAVISPFIPTEIDQSTPLPAAIEKSVESAEPLLVSIGGLEPEYAPLEQIAAMPQMIAMHPKARLIIVGDGKFRSECERAIAEAGLGQNVVLAGSLPHDTTLKLIAAADVMLRTTLYDGDAISVREALHLGTKVVATRTGSRPEGVTLISRAEASLIADAVSAVLIATDPVKLHAPKTEPSNERSVLDIYDEISGL